DHAARGAGRRLVVPAVPPGQFDRLPAALGSPRERPVEPRCRLVRQASELKKRPPDLARQRDAHLQMALWVLPGYPELGGAEADQRQRAQFLPAHLPSPPHGLRRVPGLDHKPAAAAPPRPPPRGSSAGGPAPAGWSPAAAAPGRAGHPIPIPSRAPPGRGTARPPPAIRTRAPPPRPAPPARHLPCESRPGTRRAADGWWRPARPAAGCT